MTKKGLFVRNQTWLERILEMATEVEVEEEGSKPARRARVPRWGANARPRKPSPKYTQAQLNAIARKAFIRMLNREDVPKGYTPPPTLARGTDHLKRDGKGKWTVDKTVHTPLGPSKATVAKRIAKGKSPRRQWNRSGI